jgi:hypothetical protein
MFSGLKPSRGLLLLLVICGQALVFVSTAEIPAENPTTTTAASPIDADENKEPGNEEQNDPAGSETTTAKSQGNVKTTTDGGLSGADGGAGDPTTTVAQNPPGGDDAQGFGQDTTTNNQAGEGGDIPTTTTNDKPDEEDPSAGQTGEGETLAQGNQEATTVDLTESDPGNPETTTKLNDNPGESDQPSDQIQAVGSTTTVTGDFGNPETATTTMSPEQEDVPAMETTTQNDDAIAQEGTEGTNGTSVSEPNNAAGKSSTAATEDLSPAATNSTQGDVLDEGVTEGTNVPLNNSAASSDAPTAVTTAPEQQQDVTDATLEVAQEGQILGQEGGQLPTTTAGGAAGTSTTEKADSGKDWLSLPKFIYVVAVIGLILAALVLILVAIQVVTHCKKKEEYSKLP